MYHNILYIYTHRIIYIYTQHMSFQIVYACWFALPLLEFALELIRDSLTDDHLRSVIAKPEADPHWRLGDLGSSIDSEMKVAKLEEDRCLMMVNNG